MGISSISSMIMMFFAIIIMITSIFMIYGTMLNTSQAISDQQETNQEIAMTSIKIINVTYYDELMVDRIEIWVENDGSRKVELATIDVYIDDLMIQRNDADREIWSMTPNTINPMHFDPGEIIGINVSLEMNEDGMHTTVVSTEYGVRDTKVFEVI